MDGLLSLCDRNGWALVEDGAQAHGALWQGRPVGAIGSAGAFSFYPTKNLGALGDGGAVVSGEESILERARLLRQYGWKTRYVSASDGLNSRLDEVQAAVLRVRLGLLASGNARRRAIAAAYDAVLGKGPIQAPRAAEGTVHAYHQYVVRTPRRDEARKFLLDLGVATAVLYPRALHEQPAFADAPRSSGELPRSERAVRELLCLPVFPELTDGQTGRVCAALEALVRAFS